jgi:hypothetical protein
MPTLPPIGSTTPRSLFAVWAAPSVPLLDTSCSAPAQTADRSMASADAAGADPLLKSQSADREPDWQIAHVKPCNGASRTTGTKVLA